MRKPWCVTIFKISNHLQRGSKKLSSIISSTHNCCNLLKWENKFLCSVWMLLSTKNLPRINSNIEKRCENEEVKNVKLKSLTDRKQARKGEKVSRQGVSQTDKQIERQINYRKTDRQTGSKQANMKVIKVSTQWLREKEKQRDRQAERQAEIMKDRQITGHKKFTYTLNALFPLWDATAGNHGSTVICCKSVCHWGNCPLERQINKIIKGNFSETLKDLQMFHIGESPEHFNRKIIQVAFSQVPASKRMFLKNVFNRGHLL